MKTLALYGAGDLGAEVAEIFMRSNSVDRVYDGAFFVDDDPCVQKLEGMRVVDFGGLVQEAASHDVEVAICIGEPRVRTEIASRLREVGISLATLVHPEAEVSTSATLGPGCIVYRGSYIGPNTTVGSNTLIIRGFIAHNCSIGEHCVFNANSTLACHVSVGDQTFMSIGAMVREGVSVGSRSIVGVGAAVFLDVGDDLVVAGNPAQPMRRNEDRTVFRG